MIKHFDENNKWRKLLACVGYNRKLEAYATERASP